MNEKTEKLTLSEKADLVSGKGFWYTHSFAHAGVRSLRFSDGPAGLRIQTDKKSDSMGLNKSKPATCFPAHSALACSFNAELCRSAAERIGEEAVGFGADILLGPAVNIKRNPLCGRNFEYFSEDPYLSGVLGREYIAGVQSAGAGACIKHFAANNREFGRTVCDSVVDIRTLREVYLTAFEIAVKGARPAAVMTAYNRLNGIFCNENPMLLRDILRGEWGFDGIVVSDWGGTYDRIAALEAGADLEMPACKFSADEIVEVAESGKLDKARLDECADRIVAAAERKTERRNCDFAEHARFAVKCAEECAVLLKNDGALPLKNDVKVALIGEFAKTPLYQGGGSSRVTPSELENLVTCLGRQANVIGYVRGFKRNGRRSRRLIKQAVRIASRADVCIVCLGQCAGDAEGIDRKNLRLPDNQIELLNAVSNASKQTVAVLSAGGAVEIDWDEKVSALLLAGLNGQGGAEAVANIITGKTNPSGKLAETFPLRAEDVPSTAYFNDSPYYTIYKECMNVGYRYFYGKDVKYPFGYGLSYTRFEYSDLKITENGAEFKLTNIGETAGAEAVQMYVSFPHEANAPKIQLKGFKKVFLESGEDAKIFIPFDEYTFRSYDAESGKWCIVSGEYKIYVGASSEDLRLCAAVVQDGEAVSAAAPQTENLKGAEYKLAYNEKGRVIVDMHTPFSEMINSRAGLVRFAVRCALSVTKNNPTVGGTLRYAHVRTGAQFSRFDSIRAEGLLDAFNGRYVRGVFKMIKGGKKKKRKEN